MNKNIKLGFTLLEVLVVVLIIATLASIAVPQYQRAVYKSRFHALMPVAKGIYQGNEVYYLGNRRYATNLSSLIVTGQNEYPDGTSVQLADNDNFSYVLVNRPGVNNNYVMYQSRSKQYPSNIHCEAKKGDAMATWLCQNALGGTKVSHGSLTKGYDTYIIQGNTEDGAFAIAYTNESNLTLEEGDTCSATQANACQNLQASGAECEATGVNGGCANSSYDDGSACSIANGGKQGCAFSEFSNNSTCTAGQTGGGTSPVAGCQQSVFTNGSVCVVNQNNASGAVNTACGGNDKGGKTDTTGANSAQYYNSECVNESTNSFGCGRSWYKEGSTCTSNATNGGCGNSLFDGSRCIGRGGNACDKSNFTNGSVCEARASGTCPISQSTYDNTSYCTGENDSKFSYCPAGTPAPPTTPGGDTTGRQWRKCTAKDGAPKSGMSCYDD